MESLYIFSSVLDKILTTRNVYTLDKFPYIFLRPQDDPKADYDIHNEVVTKTWPKLVVNTYKNPQINSFGNNSSIKIILCGKVIIVLVEIEQSKKQYTWIKHVFKP